MERMNFVKGNVCDRLEKDELGVSNIYDHSSFMIRSARLNDLQRFIKKQIKNVKNKEL
jgi:hypothetical protein